jgi:hypothetical protein
MGFRVQQECGLALRLRDGMAILECTEYSVECHDWYEKLLCNPFEFTFLHNTFVRLVRAFDPVSKFDVFGRHELRHFVGAAAATTKRWSSRSVAYTLTDLKPMLFQVPSPLDFGVGS